MRVYVGTSGYSYEAWKGTFYPLNHPSSKMLAFYAARLPTVELNHTFYRIPTEESVLRWASEVPERFMFAVKVPQRVTHRRDAQVEPALRAFVDRTSALRWRLGPRLFQFPPFFRKDLGRLGALLAPLPDGEKSAFEFRHPSWFDDDALALLRGRGSALVTVEGEGMTFSPIPTADFGYLRLRLAHYDDDALKRWAERILEQPWEEAFVYLKHEDEARGPGFCSRLMEYLGSSAVLPTS